MKLEVSCPLSCTGQSCHDDHQLRKARAIPIGQHLCCHWYQSAEQNSAHAFPHLAEQKEESFTQVPQRTSTTHTRLLERTREHRAHARQDQGCAVPVLPNNVSGQELQQLPVLLHHVQLVRVLGGGHGHPGQPGLQSHGLHTGQLGQGAAEAQQAGVGALLSWGESYCQWQMLQEACVKMAFLESLKLWPHSLPQIFFQAPCNLRQHKNSVKWKRQDGGDPTGTYSAGRAWWRISAPCYRTWLRGSRWPSPSWSAPVLHCTERRIKSAL